MESRVFGDVPNLYPKLQVSQGIKVDSGKVLQWIATRHGEDSSLFVDPFVIKKPDHDNDSGFDDQHQYSHWPVHDKKVTSAAVGTRTESFTG